jgi:hypothetical protein
MQDPRATLALVARVRKVRQRLRQCLSGETEVASSSLSAGAVRQLASASHGSTHTKAPKASLLQLFRADAAQLDVSGSSHLGQCSWQHHHSKEFMASNRKVAEIR